MIICQCESKKKNTGLKVWQHWYGKMSWPSNNQISLSNHQSVIPPVKWDQLGTYWASFWAPFLLLSFLPLLQLHVLSFYQCDQGVTSPLELLHNTHQIRSFELPHMKIYTHTKKHQQSTHKLKFTMAVLDLRNQSKRNWGELRIHWRNSSYTLSLSKPSLWSIQMRKRSSSSV